MKNNIYLSILIIIVVLVGIFYFRNGSNTQKVVNESLPNGQVGVMYQAQIDFPDIQDDNTWSAKNLPPGLSIRDEYVCIKAPCLSPTVIEGKPTSKGTYDIIVSSSDKKQSKIYTLIVE